MYVVKVILLVEVMIVCTGAQSRVVQDPVDTTVCQGDNAAFTCVVFIQSGGVVVPSWFRDGVMVNPTSHTITTNRTDNTIAPAYISSTVTVSSVTTLDDGAMFNCDILSLVVSNTSALRVVDVPSGVMNVIIRDGITNESFVVLWDEVMDIFTITYNVSWYNDSGIIGMNTVNSPPYTVTGLTANTSYNVTVGAINTCGAGPVSDVVEAMTNMREPTSSPTHSPGGSSGDSDDSITVVTIIVVAVMVICAI